MNKAVLHSMTDAERRLVAETEPAAIAELDEEELLELHTRIRRARGKRDRDKAEIFELSLARVSRQVAKAAAQTAQELKEERLAAARGTAGRPAATTASARSATAKPSSKRAATKTTGGLKKDASSRAQGARRQGKRDAR